MWDDIQHSIMSTHIHQHANILSATSRFSPEKFPLSSALSLSIYLSISLCRPHYCTCKEWQRGKRLWKSERKLGEIYTAICHSKYTVDTRPQLSGRCTVLKPPERAPCAQLSASSAQIRSGHRVLATPHREEGLWLCLWSSSRGPSGPFPQKSPQGDMRMLEEAIILVLFTIYKQHSGPLCFSLHPLLFHSLFSH